MILQCVVKSSVCIISMLFHDYILLDRGNTYGGSLHTKNHRDAMGHLEGNSHTEKFLCVLVNGRLFLGVFFFVLFLILLRRDGDPPQNKKKYKRSTSFAHGQ